MCACCPAATHTTWLRRSSRLWPVLCEPPSPLILQSKASPARRGVCDPVTELAHPPRQGQGMLLLQGEPDPVTAWAERGLMPVHVVPPGGWADHRLVQQAEGLFVPGVGNSHAGMGWMRAVGGPRMIDVRLSGGRPVMCIC